MCVVWAFRALGRSPELHHHHHHEDDDCDDEQEAQDPQYCADHFPNPLGDETDQEGDESGIEQDPHEGYGSPHGCKPCGLSNSEERSRYRDAQNGSCNDAGSRLDAEHPLTSHYCPKAEVGRDDSYCSKNFNIHGLLLSAENYRHT